MSQTERTQPYPVVPLLKNHIYPTYQLHAVMANKKTDLHDGLRLAALTTYQWLGHRLGADIPPVLQALPDPEEYRTAQDTILPSLHLSAGYVVDIVSMPEQGRWSLQITEPDLGPRPGDTHQARSAVPGRVIETGVEYRIAGQQLECGFRVMISDPDGTETQAEVYRLAIIKRLANHPQFGLRHLTNLNGEVENIDTAAALTRFCETWRDARNQMPAVVFTYVRPEMPAAGLPALRGNTPVIPGPFPALPKPTVKRVITGKSSAPQKPPYDLEPFARSSLGYARVYLVADTFLERFNASAGTHLKPGEIAVMEPSQFGGVTVLPYRVNGTRQKETIDQLKDMVMNYPRGKEYRFGSLTFLSKAREDMMTTASNAVQRAEEVAGEWAEKMQARDAEWTDMLRSKEKEILALTQQVDRLKRYQEQIEGEKEQLRREQAETEERCQRMLHAKDEDIAYLNRKMDRPKEHADIPAWVEQYFSGRLLLHARAISLLEDRSAKPIDLGLICDALDFLATDYWDRRYERISTEEMNSRCSEKYGRPFDIRPTGVTTIEFTPTQYKIKYFPGVLGKPVESALDYHLAVGNDPENLLRIYFLHDDEKKLIVVGSLPRHLKAVSIS